MEAADVIERLAESNAKLLRLDPHVTGYANGYADALDDGARDPMPPEMVDVAKGLQAREITKLRTALIEIYYFEAHKAHRLGTPDEIMRHIAGEALGRE